MHIVEEGPGETPSALRCLSYLITNFLTNIKQLAKTSRGALSILLLMAMSEAFSVPFRTLRKLFYTKALEWPSLVPGPKAKCSSLEIMNPTLFTISSQNKKGSGGKDGRSNSSKGMEASRSSPKARSNLLGLHKPTGQACCGSRGSKPFPSAYEVLRIPWTARRSNQSILKEINPKYLLEGLMLKLKLQYFGYLMQRANSLEKTLMLGKTEGRRRRGWQKMRWLDDITDSMDELEQTPGDGQGQGRLACCSPWGCKQLDTTGQLNNRTFYLRRVEQLAWGVSS